MGELFDSGYSISRIKESQIKPEGMQIGNRSILDIFGLF